MKDSDPLFEKVAGVLPAIVIPIGLLLIGTVIAGPIWRLSRRLRTRRATDRRARIGLAVMRTAAVVAFPAFLLYVVALWANIRAIGHGYRPPPWTVAVLLLGLAAVAIAVEVWLKNPIAEEALLRERELRRATKEHRRLERDMAKAYHQLERSWGDLRSVRDDLLSLARHELSRAWESLIFTARMRHGVTGHRTPDLMVHVTTGAVVDDGDVEPATPPEYAPDIAEHVRGMLEFFRDVRQPLPGLGPLNEVIRLVDEKDPARIQRDWKQVTSVLHGQLGYTEPRHPWREGPPAATTYLGSSKLAGVPRSEP